MVSGRSKRPLSACHTRCRYMYSMLSPVIMSQTGIMSNRYRMSLVSTSRTNASPKSNRTRCPEESASLSNRLKYKSLNREVVIQ